ncbi:unnamed protein product [Parnassius apollo]|uniref:Farnesyl pyrophosphate synthase n=1 Tax=Parnassius apollo TaxID=110799 RepID=A0A8S3XZV0_PARAO|nr:unnamed protein product [Parnassius apollo]
MMSRTTLFKMTKNVNSWSPVHRTLLTKQNMVSKNIYTAYQDYLPTLIDNALSHKRFERLPEVKDRIKRISEYNIIGGKQLRGLLTLFTYETLKKPDPISDELWEEAFKLAWAIEMLQAVFIISDDVDDDAVTRRGKKCWHLLPDVGLLVINDVSLFRSFIHEVLRQNFGDKPNYTQIINLFNETIFNTSMGQHLDCMLKYLKNPGDFNDENYRKMSIYKTSHYTFRLPILLAMIHSQKGTKDSYQYIDNICDEIGINLQMQNDFMDCFVDENSMGKTGTDIQTGQLTWLAVEALKRCNSAQRKEFDLCYGNQDPVYVERVRNLYKELGLPQVYRQLEKTRYEKILKQINDLPPGAVPNPEVFLKALDLIYNKTQIINYSQNGKN